MKLEKLNNYWVIGIGLIALSAVLHYAHYLMFHNLHHTLIFLVADIAFIPLEVFFVTLVLDKLLESREKQHLIKKLNMLIGLFYSEFGADLFQAFVIADNQVAELEACCQVKYNWQDADFKLVKQQFEKHGHEIAMDKLDLVQLKTCLSDHKELLLNLIANPNLLEHESFSELLMAVFHLQEELAIRDVQKDQAQMDEHDVEHLKVDIERVYRHISVEWVRYLKHLKEHYPYLFLTACKKNPYDQREEQIIENEIIAEIYTR